MALILGLAHPMAAQVLATKLGLPHFHIDASSIVNKYVGETGKNLRRLFDQAEHGNSILFFDEADAMFGRRTKVNDSHDRYANVDLTKLAALFDEANGLVILAANRAEDIDRAAVRRFRHVMVSARLSAQQRPSACRNGVIGLLMLVPNWA